MSSLTEEQQLAVDKKNTNIIVSAGAGSGKTTVLKTRVLRELMEGVNINNLIILTFTNNAAAEMKERIRKIINENECVKEQALYLDSAYITTFDSFAQSLVKKYNYLLNMSKNFSIIDSSIISIEIDHVINDIFEELYEKEDENFFSLISDFQIKDDKEIRKAIKKYYNGLSNIIDKKNFLDTYIDKHFNNEFINKAFSHYENIVFKLRDDYLLLLEELKDYTLNEKAIEFNESLYYSLDNATTFEELSVIDFKICRANKGYYDEDSKSIRDNLKTLREEIEAYLLEDRDTLIEHFKSTKNNTQAIIDILIELDKRITEFKDEHNSYEFSDIALKAIELVKNHRSVREEIKNNTYEIMIDEYQDTNDIQEEFISYIQNDNVYMVGDIKQSIYRFRNANPYIFKKKYDDYSSSDKGFKIDLNKNFRSRNEVVNNINLIFDNIMFDDIGGADYKNQHEMIYGNKSYLEHDNNDSYDMEILSYSTKDTEYKSVEAEAFIIADDILKKINAKEKVTFIDKDGMKSRDIEYQDFCILVDKSKNFELLKKILEYHNIPTIIYKDISIKDEDEIYILKNLINLIIKVKQEKFDTDFVHYYMSIARSYIFKMSDEDIYEVIRDKTYKDTELYKSSLEIAKMIDGLSNKELLDNIISKFDIINKLALVGDVEERLTKLEYFINNATNLNNFGMNIYELSEYFDSILDGEDDIKMSTNKDTSSNSVKIMTIHASKGLEYPYVYLPYLNNNFKKSPDNSRFKYSSKYGFIIPFYQDGIGQTFMNDLRKNIEDEAELSEKIRLFYVALTRAKEKIIIINEFNDKITPEVNVTSSSMLNLKSYADMLTLIKYSINKYIKEVNLDDLNISSDYNLVKDNNYHMKINNNTKKINFIDLNLENNMLESKHFSKSLSKIIDRDFKERLEFGTFMHYVFEVYNFQDDNLEELDLDDMYKEKITNFLKHDEVKNIKDSVTYKEYEIMFTKDGSLFHGFIDLLVEYEDHFDIIDYKLSNINSPEYVEQLSGYKDYIENKFKKPCNIYLYSINKDIFKKLN